MNFESGSLNLKDHLKIWGGKTLSGKIQVRGAKNFVPKAMVASLLTDEPCELTNVPNIRDVEITKQLLHLHGYETDYDPKKGILKIAPKTPGHIEKSKIADVQTLSGASRIPILFCGPLLHRLGEALIPDVGGCKIGTRPINFHFDALRAFGAEVEKTEFGIWMIVKDKLKGAKIELPFPSVGATEQVLLTSVLADGLTELTNAAIEPEIMDLIALLQKMGALITVEPNRVIKIEGVKKLHGYKHKALTDRIEVASWASLALANNSKIFCEGANQNDLSAYLNTFLKIGGAFEVDENGIWFQRKNNELKSIALETEVHPGFMTDWQQPLVVALTQANGVSIIHETVYEDRFGFTRELNKMGAKIQIYTDCLGSSACRFQTKDFGHSIAIFGPTPLKGSEIEIPDLRAGFSYIIASLCAKGESNIEGVSLINRGYENFEEKLQAINADFSFA